MLRVWVLPLLQGGALGQNHSHVFLAEGSRSTSGGSALSQYIKHARSNSGAGGSKCILDAYDGSASWLNSGSYLYNSLDKCADLCDSQSTCVAFVDNWLSSPPHCSFKTSAKTASQFGTDLYEKHEEPAGDTCTSWGWPRFASQAELASDAWGVYFTMVYGALPSFTYPLCVGDLWLFYDHLLQSSGASAPPIKGNCPSSNAQEGERYLQNNMYQPSGVSYAWHWPPYAAIASNTWVEVSHQADPFGDEHYGMWLMLATGNGVWFNTGKTVVFETHDGAYDAFGVNSGDWNEEMCKEGVRRGYDSVQFTDHTDHVNYPCDGDSQSAYMNLEIVAVKLTGTYACGASSGAASAFRAGWQGSRACSCDESRGTLNCGVFAGDAGALLIV